MLVVDPDGRGGDGQPGRARVLGVTGPQSGRSLRDRPATRERVAHHVAAGAEPWQPPEPLRGPLEDALQKQQPFFTQAFDQTVGFRLDGEDRAYLPQILPIRDPTATRWAPPSCSAT